MTTASRCPWWLRPLLVPVDAGLPGPAYSFPASSVSLYHAMTSLAKARAKAAAVPLASPAPPPCLSDVAAAALALSGEGGRGQPPQPGTTVDVVLLQPGPWTPFGLPSTLIVRLLPVPVPDQGGAVRVRRMPIPSPRSLSNVREIRIGLPPLVSEPEPGSLGS